MPDEQEGPEGPENFDEPPAFFPLDGLEGEREGAESGDLVEVQIDGIYEGEERGNIAQFVIVSENGRRLPIRIGGFEAKSIQDMLEGRRADRPMTHDLTKNIIDRLGGSINRVVIDDLWNGVYYAKIYLQVPEEELEIDARPSDAIAMAMRFEAPIYVADSILSMA